MFVLYMLEWLTEWSALQNPYQTNLLVAGYDEDAGAELYWLDYLATMHKMNIAGTGYGELLCHGPVSPEHCCLPPVGNVAST